MAPDVVGLNDAATVQGRKIRVDASNGVKVDSASVIKSDIVRANGVIHLIDGVIVPKRYEPTFAIS